MIERPDAAQLLAGPLGSWLAAQNAEREAMKQKCAKVRMTGIGTAVAIAAVIVFLTGRVQLAMIVGFFIGTAALGIAEFIQRPLINRLKGGINGEIARALGLNFAVEVARDQPFARAKQFDMVPGYDSEYFQDRWWGNLGQRPFSLHEAKLTEQRGSGKSRRTVTVFEGSIMAIGFARRFAGTTLIEGDGERRKFLIGPEKERATIGGIEMQRLDLSHPDFEARFSVWSNDPVESQYLVHPSYVERLLEIERAFTGKNIRALFHEGDLVIVLETGNLFESGSLEAGDDRALLERSIEQFGSLADLAAQLNERERMTFADIARSNSAGP